jgi:hypothetical protein
VCLDLASDDMLMLFLFHFILTPHRPFLHQAKTEKRKKDHVVKVVPCSACIMAVSFLFSSNCGFVPFNSNNLQGRAMSPVG